MTHKIASARRQGFTLVEMMVGLTLLGVFMTGIFSTTRMSLLVAESAIYQNTSATVAQAYLEQIKSLPYEDVLGASKDPVNLELETRGPIFDASMNATIGDDPISLDPAKQPNLKSITFNVKDDGSGTPIVMEMKITASVTDLNTGSDPINGLEIKLEYSYKMPEIFGGNWVDGQVQAVRSRI